VVWMATSATVSSENCKQAVSSVKVIVLPESFWNLDRAALVRVKYPMKMKEDTRGEGEER